MVIWATDRRWTCVWLVCKQIGDGQVDVGFVGKQI